MLCEGRHYSPYKDDVVACCENCENHDPHKETECELYDSLAEAHREKEGEDD